jgi:hypothetical protein
MRRHDTEYYTPGQAAAIKRQLLAGVPMAVVAKRFGMPLSLVRRWRTEAADELRATADLFAPLRAAE